MVLVIFFSNSASATGRDVYLSLMERDVVCKLQLWTVLISSKTIYAEKTMVEFSDDADFQSGCWTHSGWFVYCDISGKVYRTQPNTPSPELCFEYAANSDKLCTLTCPTKQGFMIYSINDLSVSHFPNRDRKFWYKINFGVNSIFSTFFFFGLNYIVCSIRDRCTINICFDRLSTM